MHAITNRLKTFLEENGVEYEVVHHQRDVTAQRTAEDTHTPGLEYAKTVVIEIDGTCAMAVLPAHHHVDLEAIRAYLGATTVSLATEDTMAKACPDCEVGAEPPFGNLYGLSVYVCPPIDADERITCKAGSHEDVIRLAYADFERLVQPRVIDFSIAP